MSNARKIARNIRLAEEKKARRQQRLDNRMNNFSWDTLEEMRINCHKTIANNAMLVREILKHPDLANADPVDVNRVASIATTVTNELVAQLDKIAAQTNGRSGELISSMDSDDFDVAVAIFDMYDNITSSIHEQYASITDTLYLLKQQIKDQENEKVQEWTDTTAELRDDSTKESAGEEERAEPAT